jgi:hypothetical protein
MRQVINTTKGRIMFEVFIMVCLALTICLCISDYKDEVKTKKRTVIIDSRLDSLENYYKSHCN